MRLRNNPNALELLTLYKNYIVDPRLYKGHWREYFGNDHEIRLEIGAGKGQFIIALSLKNPDINYIAVEKFSTVALRLISSIPGGLANLAVVCLDAELLEECLDEGDISRLYLNFSDPWPKKRHTKRRLTSSHFLDIYQRILQDGSLMELKTDNRRFFDYSVEQLSDSVFDMEAVTFDLYNSVFLDGNLPTEYELRFHNLGTPINKLIARLNKAKIKEKAPGGGI